MQGYIYTFLTTKGGYGCRGKNGRKKKIEKIERGKRKKGAKRQKIKSKASQQIH